MHKTEGINEWMSKITNQIKSMEHKTSINNSEREDENHLKHTQKVDIHCLSSAIPTF